MQITFLGTGTSTGIPFIGCQCAVCQSTNPYNNRLRSSILVQHQSTTVVIDTGPDFRQQMLRSKPPKLDAVLLTHIHNDHLAGLDDIRAYNTWQKRDMPVYATPDVQQTIRTIFPYMFEKHKYPGTPSVILETIEHRHSFRVGDIEFLPLEIMHGNLPITCFRMGNAAYITDAKYIKPAEMEQLMGLKVLIINALQKKEHWSHFTLNEALAVIEQLQPERAYLTHISHHMGLYEEVNPTLPTNVALAYDNLVVTV